MNRFFAKYIRTKDFLLQLYDIGGLQILIYFRILNTIFKKRTDYVIRSVYHHEINNYRTLLKSDKYRKECVNWESNIGKNIKFLTCFNNRKNMKFNQSNLIQMVMCLLDIYSVKPFDFTTKFLLMAKLLSNNCEMFKNDKKSSKNFFITTIIKLFEICFEYYENVLYKTLFKYLNVIMTSAIKYNIQYKKISLSVIDQYIKKTKLSMYVPYKTYITMMNSLRGQVCAFKKENI